MIRPGRKQTNWQPHGYQGFGFFIHGLWSGSPPDTEAGARCVNRARRDLCGGYPVTGIPTATLIGGQIMLRQTDIAAAFRESILRSSKGFQYIHTRDFVTALRLRGIHFSEVEANSWIAREQTYFVDKTPDHSENRLWMMAGMGRGSDGASQGCWRLQSIVL